MAEPDQSLAERLLAGDKRALARAISLVEDDDPAGWELVRQVFPSTRSQFRWQSLRSDSSS